MSSVTVVKIGGSTLGASDTSIEDIARLYLDGVRLVVVHGGGAKLSEWLTIHGVESKFVRGLRVTLEVAIAVLAGVVNKELTGRLNTLGARAIGLCGVDAAIIRASRLDPALGYVGQTREVDRAALESLLDDGFLPVIASIGAEVEGGFLTGQALNINADTVAGDVAAALEAERLVFLTDVAGVLDGSGELVAELTRAEALRLVDEGVVKGGMIPKVEAALVASAAGARALIIDGRQEHALCQALEAGAASEGTTIAPA